MASVSLLRQFQLSTHGASGSILVEMNIAQQCKHFFLFGNFLQSIKKFSSPEEKVQSKIVEMVNTEEHEQNLLKLKMEEEIALVAARSRNDV